MLWVFVACVAWAGTDLHMVGNEHNTSKAIATVATRYLAKGDADHRPPEREERFDGQLRTCRDVQVRGCAVSGTAFIAGAPRAQPAS